MNSIHLRIEANSDHPIAACFDEAAALTNRHGETVKYDVRITHAEQIGAGTQAVIRLTPEDDLTID